MNQRWWIAIVAVVGIGLAVLLFPRPDTGEAIPGAERANVDPVAVNGEGATPAPATTGRTRPPIDPDRVRTGVKPGMEARVAQRNRPEAIYASKVVTPLSAIRYTMMKEGSEPAKAIADDLGTLMNGDLRSVRTDPDAIPWADLQKNMDSTIAKVEASQFGSDETIKKSVARYREFIAEYHQAKSTEGAAPAAPSPEAKDIPPGAPPGTPAAEPVEE